MSIDNSLDTSIRRLLRVMKQLRDPETGCEWDKKQTNESLIPYLLEEVYEVIEAIENKDYSSLKEELGDPLISELGLFKFEDVVNSISEKLINRHPYVFTEQRKHTQEEQLDNWEEIKLKEKEKKNLNSIMDDLPRNLPALLRSQKIQRRAGKVGFDWDSEEVCFKKIEEEIIELKEAINSSVKVDIKNELGDVLISVVNLAKHLKVDAEDSLRQGNLKFENRFRFIETELKKKNKTFSNTSLEEMDLLWEKAKQDL